MKTLQFITNRTNRFDEIEGARLALEGGCRYIQLRAKNCSLGEIEQMALLLLPLCHRYQAKLIINDHVAIARSVKADGVHLGLSDMSIAEARRILGPKAIIGGTAHTFEEIKKVYKAGANYAGVGPFRFTKTKKVLRPFLGLEGYSRLLTLLHIAHISLPIFAIGGITLQDVPSLRDIGVSGLAISGALLQAKDPRKETKQFIQAFTTNL